MVMSGRPARRIHTTHSFSMDVYLVPVDAAGYALYCEVAAPADEDELGASASFVDRMKASFRRAVDEGEAQRAGAPQDSPDRGRFRRFITRKIAETVAEQRLLWNLRHKAEARLFHPDRVDGAKALQVARAEFTHDYARHRRWLVINGLLAAITGPALFFVPGPNVLSWYFTFRAVGHFFSMRGARRALDDIAWTPVASALLTEVADALALDPEARAGRLAAVSAALGLDRLAAFVERISVRTA